jgi:hypothetical protein
MGLWPILRHDLSPFFRTTALSVLESIRPYSPHESFKMIGGNLAVVRSDLEPITFIAAISACGIEKLDLKSRFI